MSGTLSDKPDGTTLNAQMANTGLPAGERPNKGPIFISGVHDTRAFLPWRPDGPTKVRHTLLCISMLNIPHSQTVSIKHQV
jgi:hypothetical protein